MRMNDASPAAIQRCYAYLHEHHAEIVARRKEREKAEREAQGGEEREEEGAAKAA